jgi:hypothetical protein
MVSPGVVGGASFSGSIQFLDGVALGGSFNASFANSAGSRALEFSGGTDRDGNRVPIRMSTRNAAGTSVAGFEIGAGSAAGSVSIGSNGAVGTVLLRAVGTIQGGGANQNGGFFDVTFPSDATGFARGVYSRVHSAAAAFALGDAPAFYAANPIAGGGSTITRAYGLYVEAITAAGTNYAIATLGGVHAFGGSVGIGLGTSSGVPNTPSATLHVVETSAGALTAPARIGNQSATVGTAVGIAFHVAASGAQNIGLIQAVLKASNVGDLVFSAQAVSGAGPVERLRARGDGPLELPDITAFPAGSPAAGKVWLASIGGVLKAKTPSGTVTTLAI